MATSYSPPVRIRRVSIPVPEIVRDIARLEKRSIAAQSFIMLERGAEQWRERSRQIEAGKGR
jgi:hypothetical protein